MKPVQGLKVVAMIPLGFMVAILILFAVGESVGGDLSGLMHLVPVAFVGLVIWLCWKRPLWGGLLLLLGAIVETFTFRRLMLQAEPGAIVTPLAIMILPLAFSGLLLLLVEWMERIH